MLRLNLSWGRLSTESKLQLSCILSNLIGQKLELSLSLDQGLSLPQERFSLCFFRSLKNRFYITEKLKFVLFAELWSARVATPSTRRRMRRATLRWTASTTSSGFWRPTTTWIESRPTGRSRFTSTSSRVLCAQARSCSFRFEELSKCSIGSQRDGSHFPTLLAPWNKCQASP